MGFGSGSIEHLRDAAEHKDYLAKALLGRLEMEGKLVAQNVPQGQSHIAQASAEERAATEQARQDAQRAKAEEARNQEATRKRCAATKQKLIVAGVLAMTAKREYLLRERMLNNTLSKDLNAMARELQNFIAKTYAPAMQNFGSLAGEFAQCYGAGALRDLSITHGWLGVIVH